MRRRISQSGGPQSQNQNIPDRPHEIAVATEAVRPITHGERCRSFMSKATQPFSFGDTRRPVLPVAFPSRTAVLVGRARLSCSVLLGRLDVRARYRHVARCRSLRRGVGEVESHCPEPWPRHIRRRARPSQTGSRSPAPLARSMSPFGQERAEKNSLETTSAHNFAKSGKLVGGRGKPRRPLKAPARQVG